MQHRIFLVPHRRDLGEDVARRHWEQRHGDVFTATPGLATYRQNRPLDAEWDRGRARFCSETWYLDRDSERAAYGSAYYRDVVATDESYFLVRDAAWSAVVLDSPSPRTHDGTRVLWFSDDPPAGQHWEALELTRPVPAPGRGNRVHTAWVDDPAVALEITAGTAHVSLACRSHTTDVATTPPRGNRP